MAKTIIEVTDMNYNTAYIFVDKVTSVINDDNYMQRSKINFVGGDSLYSQESQQEIIEKIKEATTSF